MVQQLAAGWGFPNALLQHAIGDLETLSVDIGAIQARRDRMVTALRIDGLRGHPARGHLLPHGPLAGPRRHRVHRAPGRAGALVLPGTIVESPGWFRISLTASDAMVDRGLEAFRRPRPGESRSARRP